MTWLEWLFTPIQTHRYINIWWYVATFVLAVIALGLAYRYKILKIGLLIWFSGMIWGFTWEIPLLAIGGRSYTSMNILGFLPELIYHNLTEVGTPFLFGFIALYKFNIIDLSRYQEE
ncbi:MAG: hypothetical protein HWN67_15130 [Candidatus Helarchaeota archaeon]|nr:hypothetical protein [Candidatus Helarchaeota archaeon]